MTTKGWWTTGLTIVFMGILGIAAGVFYLSSRAQAFRRGIDSAMTRYADLNRDFPFTAPSDGQLDAVRFTAYLQVRQVLQSAASPLQELRESPGALRGLVAISTLPEELSRAHTDALRRQSMSLDEYRWISRQIYTTVAAEAFRKDPDGALLEIHKTHEAAFRDGQAGPFGVQSSRGAFESGVLDLQWLRVRTPCAPSSASMQGI